MLSEYPYKFHDVDWLSAATDIMDIRRKVFVVEQRFDEAVVFDEHDSQSFHVLVTDDFGIPVGCGRLVPDGHIGKIGVLINHRAHGIGSGILSKLIDIAKKNRIFNLNLSTETELTGFYDHLKFHAVGPVYMKQGVPYQRMTKRIS